MRVSERNAGLMILSMEEPLPPPQCPPLPEPREMEGIDLSSCPLADRQLVKIAAVEVARQLRGRYKCR